MLTHLTMVVMVTNKLTRGFILKVRQKTTQHGLVGHDQHILLTLQFHDHGLETSNQVFIGLDGHGT